jgi:hypothetical protein
MESEYESKFPSSTLARYTVELATVLEASSPSIEDVKYGFGTYRFCEPVLFRRSIYGMESDHPYPTMPLSVSWLLYTSARSGWTPLRPGGMSSGMRSVSAPVELSTLGAICDVNASAFEIDGPVYGLPEGGGGLGGGALGDSEDD